jgi:membrane-bound metal-dependent hydrolase YbcI (DUF457 family)
LSPVTHGLVGWIISQPLKSRRDRLIVTGSAIVSDIDGLTLLFSKESFFEYHHTFGHSIVIALIALFIAASFASEIKWTFFLGFVAFNSHIIGDLFGSGEGWSIKYFWPVSDYEYNLPVWMRWELDSWQNFLITVLCILITMYIAITRNRTPVEFVSVQSDNRIVEVLQKWSRKFRKSAG